MKKQFISLCMAWWAVTGWASPHTFQVSSPDRNYVFTFTQEEPEGKTRMYYTLSYKGKRDCPPFGTGCGNRKQTLGERVGYRK